MRKIFAVVYAVDGSDSSVTNADYVATLTEARAIVRDSIKDYRKEFPVPEHAIPERLRSIRRVTIANAPARELVCRLLNHERFALKQEDVT